MRYTLTINSLFTLKVIKQSHSTKLQAFAFTEQNDYSFHLYGKKISIIADRETETPVHNELGKR